MGFAWTENISVGAISKSTNITELHTNIDSLLNSLEAGTFTDQGIDVASANNMTLGGDGNFYDITGTTTINTIVTKGVGSFVVLQFDGILQLTHSVNLFLPTGFNITTTVGDIASFYEYAVGDWRCHSYQRADGSALNRENLDLNPTVGGLDHSTSGIITTLTVGENVVFGISIRSGW